jgi:hypothetical protein
MNQGQRNCWLVISTSHRAHGGNDGYADELKHHYLWDSTVKHHSRIQKLDVVVFWDKETLLGISVVEEVHTSVSTKNRYRCRSCGSTRIKKRKTKSPLYRCQEQDCKDEFAEAISESIEVTNYESNHGECWIDLLNLMTGTELRELCLRPKAQDSIRLFNLSSFLTATQPRMSVNKWNELVAKIGNTLL